MMRPADRRESDAPVHEIRADIERTRARMGHTVEALGEHLNVDRVKQQVKDNIRHATIGRVKNMANSAINRVEEGGRGLVATIRENPVPAAMIVGGLGWLLFARRRGHDAADITAPEADLSHAGSGWTEDAHGSLQASDDGRAVGERLSEGAHRVTETASSAAHRVTETAATAAHRISASASSAAQRVAGVASSARERVSSRVQTAAHSVATQARTHTRRVADSYESNPLALGAIAAGIGLAIGMSLPATQRESRLMGAKRDALMDQARDALSETREKVKHTAERVVPEVTDTVREVAREEGLA